MDEFLADIEVLGIFRIHPNEHMSFFNIDFGRAGYIYVPAVPALVREVIERAEARCGSGENELRLRERVASRSDFEEESFVYWSRKDPARTYNPYTYITLGEWLEETDAEQVIPLAAE